MPSVYAGQPAAGEPGRVAAEAQAMGAAQLIAAPTSPGTQVYQHRAIVALSLRVATPAAA